MASRYSCSRSRSRRILKRWLTNLGAGAIVSSVIMLGIVQVRTWRRDQAAADRLQQATRLEDDGEWLKAAESLEDYLRMRPDAADQRVRVARLHSRAAQAGSGRERAIDQLYRALGVCRSEDRRELQVQLAELLLAEERFAEAEDAASRVAELDPSDASAQRVRAIALLQQYKRGSLNHHVSRTLPIVAWLEEARRANPGDIELAELTAATFRDLELAAPGGPTVMQREQLADACLDQLVKAQSDNPLAYLARHRYRIQFDRPDADADLEQALSSGSTDTKVMLAVARAAHQRAEKLVEGENPSRALKLFATSAEIHRRAFKVGAASPDAQTYLDFGDALLAQGREAEAREAWEVGLDQWPSARSLFSGRLADLYLNTGELQLAERYLIDSEPVSESLSEYARLSGQLDQCLRRGVWNLQQGNAEVAIVEFQGVITLQEQIGGHSRQVARAWKELGRAYSILRRWPEAAAAFDYASYEEPHTAEAWVLASQAHLNAHHAEQALDRAEQAARIAARECDNGSRCASDEMCMLVGNTLAATEAMRGNALAAQRQRRLRDREWPSLTAVETERLGASTRPLPLAALLALSHVQSLRGDYERAETLLSKAPLDRSSLEWRQVARELVHVQLSRGDVREAHELLAELTRESHDNQALLKLTALVGIERDRQVRMEEAEAFVP